MSPNKNLSALRLANHASDENSETVANLVLSVRLKASKFQQLSKGCNNDIRPQSNRPQVSSGAHMHSKRSPGNISKNAVNGIDNVTLHTGSRKVDHIALSQFEPGDKPDQKIRQFYCDDGYEMASKTNKNTPNHEASLDCATSDGDETNREDHDTEYQDDPKNETIINNNNTRPKPGRLDLRQFDNITSAIAKLNVQPKQVESPKISKFITSSPWKVNIKGADATKATEFGRYQSTSDKPASTLEAAPRKSVQNSLKNHGKPVAPPRLPSNQIEIPTSSSSVLKSRMTSSIDDSAMDCCQSPITKRLLRHSKDYKVCELISPQESDSDLPLTPPKAAPRSNSRLKDSFQSNEVPCRSVTIGPYYRTHSAEPSDVSSTRGETMRQLNEMLARPPMGRLGITNKLTRTLSSSGQCEFEDQPQPLIASPSTKKSEKESKKDKKRDEKLEKRKQKEEEKYRRQEEEKQRRQEKKLAAKKNKTSGRLDELMDDHGIPIFIKRCIEFIEAEGLDAEGIYRVPGNRAHVDAFIYKYKDNPQMLIEESDIPVNAVATALKDFLSKKLGPIIPTNMMEELTELSRIPAKDNRAKALKDLVSRLSQTNYNILEYVFAHFVKVSMNNVLNSMDSKNLAICWWPTLLPLQFSDMVMFEQMRPHLEESIQTMIDQYDFIFDRNRKATRGCLISEK